MVVLEGINQGLCESMLNIRGSSLSSLFENYCVLKMMVIVFTNN